MINWKKIPFLKITVPFILGIVIAIYGRMNDDFWIWLPIPFLFISLLLGFNKRFIINKDRESFIGFVLSLGLIFLGISATIVNTSEYKESFYGHYISGKDDIQIKVLEIPKNKPNSIQVIAQVNQIIQDGKGVGTSGKVLLYFEKDDRSKKILQGDELDIRVNLNPISDIQNPGQFNYREYLRFNQIYHQGFVKSENWQLQSHNSYSITHFAASFRNKLLGILSSSGLRDDEFSVASALILGYKDDLDKDLKHSYSSAGATHVLAVSGLHVGIIYLVLYKLLLVFGNSKSGKTIRLILIICILWFYAILTGLSPSVIRAATMFSMVAIGEILIRKSNIFNTLGATAFILLLINPYLIMEVGFQLSFLAVMGIVYFQPKIERKLHFRNKILKYIWSITSVSIAAQIATFPLGLLYFHQFPVYFFISNLIVIPGAFLIMSIGLVLFITFWIPFVGVAMGKLLWIVLFSMNKIVIGIDQLPMSLYEGVSISILECWIIYAIIIFLSIAFYSKKTSYLYLSFSLGITFVGLDLYEDLSLKTKRQFVIYSIKNEPNLNFIDEGNNHFYSSKELYEDYNTMLFNILHHWDNQDARFINFRELDQSYRSHFLGKDIVFIHREDTASGIINTDILYSDSEWVPRDLEIETAVLSNGMSYATKRRWRKKSKELGFKIHDLKADGAFILE